MLWLLCLLAGVSLQAEAVTTWYRLDLHRNTSTPCQIDPNGRTSLAKGGFYKAGTKVCRKIGNQDYYVDCTTDTLHLCPDSSCSINCTSSALDACSPVSSSSLFATGSCHVNVTGVDPPAVPPEVASLGVYVQEDRAFAASCAAGSPVLRRQWSTVASCPADGLVHDCRSGVSIQYQCTHVDDVTCVNCVPSSRMRSDLTRCKTLAAQQVSQTRSCSVPSNPPQENYASVTYYGTMPTNNCAGAIFPTQIDSYRWKTCRNMSALGLGFVFGDCDTTTFYTNCPDTRCLIDECQQQRSVVSPLCLVSNSSSPTSFSLSCAPRPFAAAQPNGLELRYITEEHLTPVCVNPAVLDSASQYFNSACDAQGDGTSTIRTCTTASNLQVTTCTNALCSSGCVQSNVAADSQACNAGTIVSCGPLGTTSLPTVSPTASPTQSPTQVPTGAPTQVPSSAPTLAPTVTPGQPTKSPTTKMPTQSPTSAPGSPTASSPTASSSSASVLALLPVITTAVMAMQLCFMIH